MSSAPSRLSAGTAGDQELAGCLASYCRHGTMVACQLRDAHRRKELGSSVWEICKNRIANIGFYSFGILPTFHRHRCHSLGVAKSECHALGVAKQNYERMFAVLILQFDPSIRLGFFAFLFFFFFRHSWRGLWWQNPPLLYRLFSLNCKTTNHRSNAMVLLTVPGQEGSAATLVQGDVRHELNYPKIGRGRRSRRL